MGAITGIEMLGENLASLAIAFGASSVEHLGGARFLFLRADGLSCRALSDEGIGSIEGEDGFDEAWEMAV